MIHIINLDRRPDRWLAIKNQLPSSSLFKYNRISAIDGKNISMNREYTHLLRNYKYNKNPGAIAYAMTTIKLWQQLLMTDEDYMIIMDDDIVFCDNFENKMTELIESLHNINYDVCMFGYIVSSNDSKYNMTNNTTIIIGDMKTIPFYSGSFGYIISRTGINKLLKLIDEYGLIGPIDTLFLYCMKNYFKDIKIIASIPRLVYTEVATESNNVDSDIQRDKQILT